MMESAMIKHLAAYRKRLPGDLLFENSITAMMLVDENRAIIVVNKQFCTIFGYRPDEVVGLQTSVLTPSLKHFNEYRKYYEQTRDGSFKSSELQYRKKSGELFWTKLTGIAIPSEGVRYVLWSFDDISGEVKSRKEIHDRYLELDIIFNKVPTGLVYVVDDRIERVNPSFLAMVNREKDELIGKRLCSILENCDEERRVEGKRLLRFGKGMDTTMVEQEVQPITEHSAIVLFHNVTQHVLEKKALLDQALTDGLTGLLNRTGFQVRTEAMLSSPDMSDIAFAVFDIDFFKAVNDTHGHAVGDAVLIELAALLKGELRRIEVVGRLGGEEFGVVFPVNKDDAVLVCNRLLKCIRTQPFTEKQLKITVSIGLTASTYSRKFEEMYREADRLLYCAKRSGRNQLAFENG